MEPSAAVADAVRRNSRWVTRIGGALLILIGLALVTGGWQNFVIWLQTHVGVGGYAERHGGVREPD